MSYPTQERLAELLSYNPLTGEFIWATTVNPRRQAGAKAGHIDKDGYVSIGVDYKPRRAHRLAFIVMTGKPPLNEVDHIDGCKTNNSWANLRDVSREVNSHNQREARARKRHALPPGVMPRKNRFIASITVKGKWKYLGMFKTPEEASEAYRNAKRELHVGYVD